MKAWLATQIERIGKVPECETDDSGEYLYVIGPDDQQDFAYAVREAFVRAAQFGYDAPPPEAMLTKSDALYALRCLASWLDGRGDKSTPPVDKPLTVGQAAERLGISKRKVYDLCKGNHIRHMRNPIRILPADLKRYQVGATEKVDPLLSHLQ